MIPIGWSLVSYLMGLWLLMPMVLAMAGFPIRSQARKQCGRTQHDPRGGEGDRTSHLSQSGPGPDQPAALQGGTAV